MNKFLPFTIAVLIHLLPLTYFLLQKKNFDAPKKEMRSRPQGIDLSGFSTHRQAAKAGSVGAKKSVGSSATPSLAMNSGASSGSGIGPEASPAPSGSAESSLIISSVEPIYPPLARQKGIEGKVKLLAIYNEEGTVTVVNIIESSGTKLLDESARKAFLNWKLRPGTSGSFEKTFQFKLKN